MIRNDRRELPSLKRWLIDLNRDLLDIHGSIDPYAVYNKKLTAFERSVVVLEDRRFFSHMGIDWRAICREIAKACLLRRAGGASTIDMQFVRTVTGHRERKMARKLREMLLAYIIQFRYSKIEILRSYLAIAYFGTGLRGAESASFTLYDKPSSELDIGASAKLAALLVFPRPAVQTPKWQTKHLRRANHVEAAYVRRQRHMDKLEKRIFG